jgi:hypothetical protein
VGIRMIMKISSGCGFHSNNVSCILASTNIPARRDNACIYFQNTVFSV